MPSFEELGLAKPLLDALIAAGINEPFPIQAATLPDTMAGRDVPGGGARGPGLPVVHNAPQAVATRLTSSPRAAFAATEARRVRAFRTA